MNFTRQEFELLGTAGKGIRISYDPSPYKSGVFATVEQLPSRRATGTIYLVPGDLPVTFDFAYWQDADAAVQKHLKDKGHTIIGH